ncbi:hypothetical protein [Ralstonia solanacearum]|uniref:hypothetical protein n=2 Tax=Ralstonia solanacearum TaxID=305 RepID=UPI0005AD0AF5|nr:hypothetical protein [Ralstonia solanacearum]
MTSWLSDFPAARRLPRLWVETVWLLESREPLELVRTIELHPGLNIVWARETDSAEASGLASAGHGVGKTSLCLLLRYVLGDDASAINMLREKASAAFPKGGVAAKVHVDGVTWLVFRPYGAYSHSQAKQCSALEQLFGTDASGDFQGYLASLESAFIGRLTAQSLPGTNQPLEWRHLLAWCIRDQKTRFDGFFHWRDGEGLGFRRPRKDPPLFVSSVLGLLDADLDRLMRETEATQGALEQLADRLPELEKAPAYALAHAERQLRGLVKADEDEPVFLTTVSTSVQLRVSEMLNDASAEERKLEREYQVADDKLVEEQLKLAALNQLVERARVDRDIAQSLVDANEAEYRRLTTLRDTLDGLKGVCEHGQVEFSACEHIRHRKSTVSLPWRMDEMAVKANAPYVRAELTQAETALTEKEKDTQRQTLLVSNKRAELRRLQVRIATSETGRAQLKQRWDEFQALLAQRQQGTDSPDLARAKERQQMLTDELRKLQSSLASRKSQQSQRAESIKALTRVIAARLLGESGYGRFVTESETRPFDVSKGGEAYQVLEVLLGDIVCLMDAATSEANNHPGILVHDCPREADMSERLYRDFFLTAAEAAAQLTCDWAIPFQYVVTTTSPPPPELQKPEFVVLELQPGLEETLLFKRDLVPVLTGFEEGA